MSQSHRVEIRIDLAGAVGQLSLELERAMVCVAAGLSAAPGLTAESFQLPAAHIQLMSPPEQALSVDDARRLFQTWVVENGVRESVEAAQRFLETLRTVLAVWSLGSKQASGSAIRGADWNRSMQAEGRRFHAMGLPTKLEWLKTTYGLELEKVSVERLLSINRLRNCLVHRAGVVGPQDVDETGSLQVKWLRIGIVIDDAQGSREVELPVNVAAGGTLSLRMTPELRQYPLGKPVRLTARELVDIGWTLFSFGSTAVQTLEAHATRLGVVLQPKTERQDADGSGSHVTERGDR